MLFLTCCAAWSAADVVVGRLPLLLAALNATHHDDAHIVTALDASTRFVTALALTSLLLGKRLAFRANAPAAALAVSLGASVVAAAFGGVVGALLRLAAAGGLASIAWAAFRKNE